jgi:DUF4097 and DUF4098 domain-containing protein YvlB
VSEERERILKLLEDGKITADQAARLIEALGARTPGIPMPPPVTGIRLRRHGAFRELDRIPEMVANAMRSGMEDDEESTQEFAGKRDLSVKTVSGDVSVSGEETERVTVSYSGGMVKIRSREAGVQVRSVSGDVEGTMPRAGMLEAETVSGDIGVEEAGDRFVLKSVSGDVTIEGAQGEANVSTVSGDIELAGFRGLLAAETKSGDVDLAATGPVSGLVTSKSGDIDVALPATVDLELELEIEDWDEASGEIEIELDSPHETVEQRDGYAHLKLGAGGPKLVCRTRAGDITVRNAEED